jgi:hypothetical protein
MTRKSTKKLMLRTETVRTLSPPELEQAAGGGDPVSWVPPTRFCTWTCPPITVFSQCPCGPSW